MTDHLSTSRHATWAYLISSIAKTPFWALFGMIPFILYKNLHADPWLITLFISLKPLVAIFSMYWGAHIFERGDRIRMNILLASLLAYVPFLLTPWISSPLYLVLASGIFMFFLRGATPGWMELLKRTIPPLKRERIFALGSNFSWLGGGIFPILIGYSLDTYADGWRWDLFLASSVAIAGALALFFLLPHLDQKPDEAPEQRPKHLAILDPWKNAYRLMTGRPDFALFQFGFLFGGAGLMLMQPALPLFFVDTLALSYTELAIAFTLCKGIGFALSSPTWASSLSRTDIFRFTALVTLLAGFFPLLLIASIWQQPLIFIAYIGYGIMQAGSEMSWNLSGPIFAKEEDSSIFTSVNVVMVGLRGCIAPLVGSALCFLAGPITVLLIGGICCLCGSVVLVTGRVKLPVTG